MCLENQKAKRPFGMRDKLAYAAGDLGCNMSFSLKGTVQTFWLAYMMLETGLLSALLLVGCNDNNNKDVVSHNLLMGKIKYVRNENRTTTYILLDHNDVNSIVKNSPSKILYLLSRFKNIIYV